MNTLQAGPAALFRSLWLQRHLIHTLITREVASRYKGSSFGLLWSLLNPVLMLVIYTFVFSTVFKARWGGGSDSKTEFALMLFAGLIPFNLFSDCINRAPTLIAANTNYVKKVVFPIEILPVVTTGASLFHGVVNWGVWLIFYCIFFGVPHITVMLLPLAILPLALLALGASWFLASLGVYLRDTTQIVGVLSLMLMFLSPIFFPASALPAEYQVLLAMNPLTVVIEQMRDILFWGKIPDLIIYAAHLSGSAVVALAGFAWFQRTRAGFADVL